MVHQIAKLSIWLNLKPRSVVPLAIFFKSAHQVAPPAFVAMACASCTSCKFGRVKMVFFTVAHSLWVLWGAEWKWFLWLGNRPLSLIKSAPLATYHLSRVILGFSLPIPSFISTFKYLEPGQSSFFLTIYFDIFASCCCFKRIVKV